MFRAPYLELMDEPLAPSPRSLPDGVLALRIGAAHDGAAREAEEELCRRFAPRIRLYGIHHLRDAPAAADLVQEVLLAVLSRLRSGALREPDRIASFVLGCCRLAVSERRNGSARRGALLARYGDGLAPSEPEGPRIDVDRLEQCLAGLPPRERAVLQLTFYAERASEEIGRELEAIAATIRRLTAGGRFREAVAPSLVDLLAARGMHLRTFRPRLGGTIPCGTAPGDELLVARIAVDLRGVTRLDLVACDETWRARARQVDVPVDRVNGEVVFVERVDHPALATTHVIRLRLVAVEKTGERELGTCALAHDPRGPPGAGATEA